MEIEENPLEDFISLMIIRNPHWNNDYMLIKIIGRYFEIFPFGPPIDRIIAKEYVTVEWIGEFKGKFRCFTLTPTGEKFIKDNFEKYKKLMVDKAPDEYKDTAVAILRNFVL